LRSKYSVLIIAEAANPEWVSVPLVGWSLANALRDVANVHIVTQIRNREAIKKTGLIEGKDFTAIDSEAVAKPLWKLSNLLRKDKGKGWTTGSAVRVFSYYYFEYLVWKKFGKDIGDGKYEIVHRVTPLSPTMPSILAKKCKRANIPFVVGPLNGGVPWPKEFDSSRREEKEWLSYARNAYKLLPGYKSTLKNSSALIIGSKDTFKQVPQQYHDKCVYIPENAINPERFSLQAESYRNAPLKVCFVGRLVPYKGPDMLLEASMPLLKEGLLNLDIIGDGPLMNTLVDTVKKESLDASVNLTGWVEHADIQSAMCKSQIFAFPSIREFGGGVVLEAMALGLVPLVVDYAGPGELVTKEVGYKVPIGSRESIVLAVRDKLKWLVKNPDVLDITAVNARKRAFDYFTWQKKAQQINEIYRWLFDESEEKPSIFKSEWELNISVDK